MNRRNFFTALLAPLLCPLIKDTERPINSWAKPQQILYGRSKVGGTFHYTIDARGTDPVLTEQRVRTAIIAAYTGTSPRS
jgi:hypothetical protein